VRGPEEFGRGLCVVWVRHIFKEKWLPMNSHQRAGCEFTPWLVCRLPKTKKKKGADCEWKVLAVNDPSPPPPPQMRYDV
jgi:hypothetical protein